MSDPSAHPTGAAFLLAVLGVLVLFALLLVSVGIIVTVVMVAATLALGPQVGRIRGVTRAGPSCPRAI